MTLENSLYSTIHSQDYLGFGLGGETDFQKVSNFLELSKGDIAKLAGVKVGSVRYERSRIPVSVKERLEQIANICQLVAEHFQDVPKTTLWFKTANPLLGNISPRDMIRLGRYKRLLQFIMDARERNGVVGGTSAGKEKTESTAGDTHH